MSPKRPSFYCSRVHYFSWLTCLLMLTSLFPLAATPTMTLASELPQTPDPAEIQIANATGAVRVLYLFSTDAATAFAFRSALAPEGYNLTLTTLDGRTPQRRYLPTALRGASVLAADEAAPTTAPVAEPEAVVPAAIGVTGYDLFIIADDTTGQWSKHADLAAAINATGKPVAALGRGGYEFLGVLRLPNGQGGSSSAAQTIFQVDPSQSRPFFEEPNAIRLAGDGSVRVMSAATPVIALTLTDPLPEGVRVAGLSTRGPYPIVLAAERFLLWGFAKGPATMTSAGFDLFVNALWFKIGELALPIAGAGTVPAQGFDETFLKKLAEGGQPLHALLQLDHIPSLTERNALAERGVTLQTYLSGTFYTALIAPKFNPKDSLVRSLIRWLGEPTPDLKVDPGIAQNLEAAQAAGISTALVTFFDDVSRRQATEVLSKYTQDYHYFAGQAWMIPLDTRLITALAHEETVRWISAGSPPPQDTNDGGRAATQTDAVQNPVIPAAAAPTYLGLTGAGVRVAQFERRADVTHGDLSPRVSIGGEANANSSSHATHVAGIIAGSGAGSSAAGGTNRQWRGHAPGATIVSESYFGTAEHFADAINAFGAQASNHSYVMTYGRYDAVTVGIDQIVRGDATDGDGDSIPARLAVWAACNQGTDAQYDDEEGFYSNYSPAKNSLSVGSIDSNDMGLSMFSSKGPTFDGRIKPDVVAPGCQNGGDGGITSTQLGGGYTVKCGTSMAAPATTGVIALMLEQYHNTYGVNLMPRPSTLKAVLVNTATDLIHAASDGSDQNDPDLCRAQGPGGTPLGPGDPLDADCWIPYGPGPDFATGYGAVNAVAAVNAVRGKLFLEDSLDPADVQDDFTITIPAGRTELRVTLAWDDEPGDAALAADVNQLVNDLDLRLIGPDGTHFPFVLDPLPANANLGNGGLDPIDQADIVDARQDDNDADNVEQVLVQNPDAGTWTVRVEIDGGFPTGRAQPYSLAGDFRTFFIAAPTTGNPVDAGSKDDPVTFLVILEADQPLATGAPDTDSTFADAEAADFQVDIGGTAADIISGAPVGDQFWLNVRGQSGVYDPDYYDLEVTWTGYGTASQTDAVYFLKRRVADRVIIIDHSGSMADYDKMPAAKNAGRLFVDQALPEDRVAVVGFSTNATSPYPIREVSAGDNPVELQDAKGAIDGLNPTNMTAIGKGLLQGKAEIDTPGGSSEVWRMALMSDGMENVDPLYDTPAVKGVIQPTEIVIDTVAVGPEEAGLHALLEQIANDNGGTDFHVTETGGGIAAAAVEPAAGPSTEWMLPTTLPNRLADQYKNIAESIRREQRLWQVSGTMTSEVDRKAFKVQVDKGLASATFALNWSATGGSMRMEIRSPAGRLYKVGDPDVIYRSDRTHETWIISRPGGGTWEVLLINYKAATEYVAWLSAHTRVNLQLLIGTPAEERIAGEPIHILAVLDDGKPIPDATVIALIRGPDDRTWQDDLRLFDDGQHGDGDKGDGIYGNWYLRGTMPGNYALRARAEGESSMGEPFLRYATRAFFMRPLALYVHHGETGIAADFKTLLEASSWAVVVRSVADVPALDMQRFSLVIIGQETGSNNTWGTRAAFNAIAQHKIPVLGVNEGGYAFFGRDYLGLPIGWGNGIHGNGNQIAWNRPAESIWEYPYELTPLPDGPLTLYPKPVPVVSIFLDGKEPRDVRVYGWHTSDRRYADLVQYGGQYTLWGFADSPKGMTRTGRQLFVNTAYFTAFGGRP